MNEGVLTELELGKVIFISQDKIVIEVNGNSWIDCKESIKPGKFIGINSQLGRFIANIIQIREEGGKLIIHTQPVGQIRNGKFFRGVEALPSIEDKASCCSDEEIRTIFNGRGKNSTIMLGKLAMAEDIKVEIDANELFEKHLAILGNSGAGKSWCVAKLITEALKFPSAQMILFDLHGEYKQAFEDGSGNLPENILYLNERDLVIPYWMLSFKEFEALFVDDSNPQTLTAQISFLKQAIKRLKRPAAEKLGLLNNLNVDLPIYFSLEQLKIYAENMNEARFVLNTQRYAFAKTALRNLPPEEQEALIISKRVQFNQGQAEGEVPHSLYFHNLTAMIDKIEQKFNDTRYSFLLRPIEHARRSSVFSRFFPQVKEERDEWSEMIVWITKLFTGNILPRKNLVIVDLSGIPYEIIDIVVGLISNLIFNFNFFAKRNSARPIILFYEEAHNYIPKRIKVGENFAKENLERIAKEGRKYGICSVIISQRPNELSETVLSQCGNMIILRISNPDDQDYVGRIASDRFEGLISALATLRAGEGFIIGDAVPLPLRTIIDPPTYKPNSSSAIFLDQNIDIGSDTECIEAIERWLREKKG